MNADSIARTYRWFEYLRFARSLERCRCALVNSLKRPRFVCVLGEGDGRFTQCLLGRWPRVSVDIVELSGAMIDVARERLRADGADGSHVRFHHSDALTWTPPPDRRFDMVATHFFFDVLSDAQVKQLLQRLRPYLQPETCWLVSEFAIPRRPLGSWWARFWIAVMYRFFRVTTGLKTRHIPNWRAALQEYGFRPLQQKEFKRGFLVAELWQLAADPASR